jgi:ribosome-associated toxin RatA of RatAB toxin-antitoxin module
MRAIHLRVVVGADPVAAFDAIADFERYPTLADDVREVRTNTPRGPDGRQDSDWEVNFRRGIMRWNELEVVDRDRLHIDFDQTDGDFEDFHGSWRLTALGAGRTEVLFAVSYDFGIESLVGIMDPIAERVIKRAICSVLSGLFGDIQVLEGAEALNDLVMTGIGGNQWTP